jgi:hypothetical protein
MRQSTYALKNCGPVNPMPLTSLRIASRVRAARAAASAQPRRTWGDACLTATPAPKPSGPGFDALCASKRVKLNAHPQTTRPETPDASCHFS